MQIRLAGYLLAIWLSGTRKREREHNFWQKIAIPFSFTFHLPTHISRSVPPCSHRPTTFRLLVLVLNFLDWRTRKSFGERSVTADTLSEPLGWSRFICVMRLLVSESIPQFVSQSIRRSVPRFCSLLSPVVCPSVCPTVYRTVEVPCALSETFQAGSSQRLTAKNASFPFIAQSVGICI